MLIVSMGVAIVVGIPLLVLIAGRVGLFTGRTPANLGVRNGRLKPPSRSPNSVSSQAQLHADTGALVDYARIEPIRFSGDGAAALARIKAIVTAMSGAAIVDSRADYLYVQFSTRWMKFVDDTEFWVAPAEGVIHVRSSSRIGRKDFGVNRARIESIRSRFAGPR